jgi:hypothetical protein
MALRPAVIGALSERQDQAVAGYSPCAQKSTRAVAFERLDVNGPVPAGANDLSQSLGVVLIRLVDLHLEDAAPMPGIETNDFEPEIAEFMHQPWRHRSGLDPYAGVIPRMPADQNGDLFWNRGALTPPSLRPALSTTQMAVIFCETSNPTKRVTYEPPTVRITGRHRPDRGTIGG